MRPAIDDVANADERDARREPAGVVLSNEADELFQQIKSTVNVADRVYPFSLGYARHSSWRGAARPSATPAHGAFLAPSEFQPQAQPSRGLGGAAEEADGRRDGQADLAVGQSRRNAAKQFAQAPTRVRTRALTLAPASRRVSTASLVARTGVFRQRAIIKVISAKLASVAASASANAGAASSTTKS